MKKFFHIGLQEQTKETLIVTAIMAMITVLCVIF
jgi:hypothetical protein